MTTVILLGAEQVDVPILVVRVASRVLPEGPEAFALLATAPKRAGRNIGVMLALRSADEISGLKVRVHAQHLIEGELARNLAGELLKADEKGARCLLMKKTVVVVEGVDDTLDFCRRGVGDDGEILVVEEGEIGVALEETGATFARAHGVVQVASFSHDLMLGRL